ncbi:MAG: hypothetical protein DMD89_33680 [Candidatus Rokuibacteriota bacterium]|nr:MAG: hypothetical protein DMD89_33680 [Candidatus Rokubacteria bacterium]
MSAHRRLSLVEPDVNPESAESGASILDACLTSPSRGAGTDGKDIGADIDSVTQTTEMHKWRIGIATA